MISTSPQLGFSITSPFRAVARAGKATGHGIAVGARATAHGAIAVGKIALKPAEWLVHAAMTPVRNKVHTLRDRRANKLAWDKRKSRTPNAAERAEAASWTKAKLKGVGPHGKVLALFAGPPIALLGGYESEMRLGDPATASLVAASIPVFLAIMNALLTKTSKSGEAPANIGPGGQPMQERPNAPGTVDMTPVQEAAQSAAEDAAAMAENPSSGGGMRLPGVGPVKRSHLLVGAAVVGGIVLVVLLTRKKS